MLQIKIANKTYNIGEKEIDWDLLDNKDNTFHIIKDNKTYSAVLVEKNETLKKMVLSINGNEYTVDIKDKFDLLLDKLGMSNMTTTKMKDIKAPMPGLILSIDVKVGDTISKGDSLLILEAMKMENVLKSSGDGIIKNIKVKVSDAVEKNQILIELE